MYGRHLEPPKNFSINFTHNDDNDSSLGHLHFKMGWCCVDSMHNFWSPAQLVCILSLLVISYATLTKLKNSLGLVFLF